MTALVQATLRRSIRAVSRSMSALAHSHDETPRSQSQPPSKPTGPSFQTSVTWPCFMGLEEWLSAHPLYRTKTMFNQLGFVFVKDLITQDELHAYRELYEKFLNGTINANAHRHDLGSFLDKKLPDAENVCQIMWPSDYVENLVKGPMHQRALAISKLLQGADMAFDFDMLISKAAKSNTPVPWHQDQAYWLDMPDKRAISCWTAIDDSTVDNGCMWFGPGSHKKPLRQHAPSGQGSHALSTDFSEEKAVAVPLAAGSCTFHAGGTLHYTRGNSTNAQRRAYILNFRPQGMVKYCRERNFDHGRSGLDPLLAKTSTHSSSPSPIV